MADGRGAARRHLPRRRGKRLAQLKLSICIPTYNFGPFIGQTLDSIIAQRASDVEIVVLDGGSTDETPEVLAGYQARCPEIRYVRQEARGGIDRDMARSIELAAGDYCWLFSSDDLMKPGALARVLSEIESGLDVYLCGLTICDGQMNVLREHAVSHAPPGSVYRLHNEREKYDYFRRALTTTAFFSFMGSLIVRRERWLSGSLEPEF